MILGGADVIVIEIKCTRNVRCLNRPQTFPRPALVHGKIVFYETSPWCQKGWGLLFKAKKSCVNYLRKKKTKLSWTFRFTLDTRALQGFDLWLGKIPWRRKGQAIPVFLPGKFQARNFQRSRGACQATVHGVAKSRS